MRTPFFRWAPLGAIAILALGCDAPSERDAPVPAAEAGAHVAEALAHDDPLVRAAALGRVLPQLPDAALPDVLAAFDASSLDGLDPEYVLLATWWARFDPPAALAWGIGNPRATSYAVVAAVLRTWSHKAPEVAWGRAGSLHPDSVEMGRAAVMAGWEETDPDAALAFVRGMSVLTERQRAISHLARRRVLSLGGEGAIGWMEALPADGFRNELEGRVIGEVAIVDPDAALAWASARIANAEKLTGLPRRIGTRWAQSDPVAAMAWLASLPAGRDRDDGVMETFRDWRAMNRVAATTWIARQEPAPWLEPALALYADQVAAERPQEGLALVASFGDETLRNRFTVTIARKWMRRDRAAAQAWVDANALPDEVRERIRVAETSDEETPARGRRSRPDA